jgi:hypothetical protein
MTRLVTKYYDDEIKPRSMGLVAQMQNLAAKPERINRLETGIDERIILK